MSDLMPVAARLRSATHVTVLTGAGVSAASGVPTFRGPEGLWRSFRPEELATPDAFSRDPRLVWEWYDWRRQRIAGCEPNAAHRVLAAWSQSWPGLTVVTQNVDGLHERADTRRLLRLHGSIWDVHCRDGCPRGREPRRLDDVPLRELPPTCPFCGGLDRPGVVWFGEQLDLDTLERATAAARMAEVFLTIGTSSVVHPAAGLIAHAKNAGALVVEVNPAETASLGEVDVAIREPAEVYLPLLDAAVAVV